MWLYRLKPFSPFIKLNPSPAPSTPPAPSSLTPAPHPSPTPASFPALYRTSSNVHAIASFLDSTMPDGNNHSVPCFSILFAYTTVLRYVLVDALCGQSTSASPQQITPSPPGQHLPEASISTATARTPAPAAGASGSAPSRAAPQMPAFDHVPEPYTGPRAEEVLKKRQQFLNPTIFADTNYTWRWGACRASKSLGRLRCLYDAHTSQSDISPPLPSSATSPVFPLHPPTKPLPPFPLPPSSTTRGGGAHAVPLHVVEGRMQYLYDEDGRRYLDAFAGIVTVSVGHCHPAFVAAVARQNALLQHTTSIYLNHQIAEYAEELAAKMPGDLKVSPRCWAGELLVRW
ncbi:unnamed protein product, partial [Closterium sp. Yama58-4]